MSGGPVEQQQQQIGGAGAGVCGEDSSQQRDEEPESSDIGMAALPPPPPPPSNDRVIAAQQQILLDPDLNNAWQQFSSTANLSLTSMFPYVLPAYLRSNVARHSEDDGGNGGELNTHDLDPISLQEGAPFMGDGGDEYHRDPWVEEYQEEDHLQPPPMAIFDPRLDLIRTLETAIDISDHHLPLNEDHFDVAFADPRG